MPSFEKHGYTEEELHEWMHNPKDDKLTGPEVPEELPEIGTSSDDDEEYNEEDEGEGEGEEKEKENKEEVEADINTNA